MREAVVVVLRVRTRWIEHWPLARSQARLIPPCVASVQVSRRMAPSTTNPTDRPLNKMTASIELHPVGRNSLGGRLSVADDGDERVKMLPRGGDEESDNEGEDALLHSDREGVYEDDDDSPEAIVRKVRNAKE